METPAPLGVVLVVTAFNFPHAVGRRLEKTGAFESICLQAKGLRIGLLLELRTLFYLW